MPVFYEDRINELRLWKRDTLTFMPHFHDSFEIVYILSGSAKAIINGKEYLLVKGNICISLPNVIHAYDDGKSLDAILMIIPRRYAKSFSSILDKSALSNEVIIDKEDYFLNQIEKIISVNKEKHRFKEQKLLGYFSVLFSDIFNKAEIYECHKTPPETERRILSYCLENFRHDISLELLANELNISKNHISYIFSSKLKICLPDFIGSLRVAEAKRLIAEGSGMTDAALESGFASIRTFNRRFLAETGMTPREYAKSLGNN